MIDFAIASAEQRWHSIAYLFVFSPREPKKLQNHLGKIGYELLLPNGKTTSLLLIRDVWIETHLYEYEPKWFWW